MTATHLRYQPMNIYSAVCTYMAWDVEFTAEFAAWWDGLTPAEQETVGSAVEVLQAGGPGLGRPWVDTLKGSRHSNMKELRPQRTTMRVLFAFDPRRTAILLIGGNKRNRWADWYVEMIPVADQLYDEYLAEIRREGLL